MPPTSGRFRSCARSFCLVDIDGPINWDHPILRGWIFCDIFMVGHSGQPKPWTPKLRDPGHCTQRPNPTAKRGNIDLEGDSEQYIAKDQSTGPCCIYFGTPLRKSHGFSDIFWDLDAMDATPPFFQTQWLSVGMSLSNGLRTSTNSRGAVTSKSGESKRKN